jgi:uncharacterized alpha/beta hydrolase family protein
MRIKNSSGAILLYTIITAFVISLIAITFLLLSTAQFKIANSELKRTEAYQKLMGCTYFIHCSLTNGSTPNNVIAALQAEYPDGEVTVTRTDTPQGMQWRVSTEY